MTQKKASTTPQTGRRLIILATGGTIAGQAPDPSRPTEYQAASLGGEALRQHLLTSAKDRLTQADMRVEVEQVAQIDSKDMGPAVWLSLVEACNRYLAMPDVAGIIVTHGTDTLEESAYLLHRLLSPSKPLVLTAAMRPANAVSADGPANLLDALAVCLCDGARGVIVALDGKAWHPAELRKQHSHRLDAFDAGDAGPLALVANGAVRSLRPWPQTEPLGAAVLPSETQNWPKVALLMSHAGVDADLLHCLPDLAYQGVVFAATGNGTLHEHLLAALPVLQSKGLTVVLASRCAAGGIVSSTPQHGALSAQGLSAVQARIALLLALMTGTEFQP